MFTTHNAPLLLKPRSGRAALASEISGYQSDTKIAMCLQTASSKFMIPVEFTNLTFAPERDIEWVANVKFIPLAKAGMQFRPYKLKFRFFFAHGSCLFCKEDNSKVVS